MKIRLESSFELFRDCKAHGTASGCRWWVVVRQHRMMTTAVIIIRPGELAAGGISRGGWFKFQYNYQDDEAYARPVRNMWVWMADTDHMCPESLQEAVYIEVATQPHSDQRRADDRGHRSYLIEKRWTRRKGVGKYDRWYNKQRVTEAEMLDCCTAIAEFVCEEMCKR